MVSSPAEPAVAVAMVHAAVASGATHPSSRPTAGPHPHPSGISIAQAIKGACPSVHIAGGSLPVAEQGELHAPPGGALVRAQSNQPAHSRQHVHTLVQQQIIASIKHRLLPDGTVSV